MVRTRRIRSNRRSKKSYGRKSTVRKRSLRKKRLKRKIKRNTYRRKNSKIIGSGDPPSPQDPTWVQYAEALAGERANTIRVLKMPRAQDGLGLSEEEAQLVIDNMERLGQNPDIPNVGNWLRVKTHMDGNVGALRFGEPDDINIFNEVQAEFLNMNMINILAAFQNNRTPDQAREWLRNGNTAIREWQALTLYD